MLGWKIWHHRSPISSSKNRNLNKERKISTKFHFQVHSNDKELLPLRIGSKGNFTKICLEVHEESVWRLCSFEKGMPRNGTGSEWYRWDYAV